MLALLADHTVQNVMLGAVFLGVTAGVLGSFAVLRQQSLLGDTLAHAALPGVCLGFLIAGGRELGAILAGALFSAVAAALVVLMLTRLTRLKTDAALGTTLSFSFAVGVVLLTHIQGTPNASQGGLDSFLFGQAAATLRGDLWIMGGIMLASLALVAAFWKEFKLITFDPLFAGAIGLPVVLLDVLLTAMIALAVVVGLQMVGVVLMASMVIAPAVAARQWVNRLEHMVVLAAAFGVVAGVIGALISALGPNLATGPLIVLAASAIVVVSLLIARGRGLLWQAMKRRHERHALHEHKVLATLHAFASQHADRRYPAEIGAIDTYHGLNTGAVLRRLERQGLVRRAGHMPDEALHWTLTDRGHAAAARIGAELMRETG